MVFAFVFVVVFHAHVQLRILTRILLLLSITGHAAQVGKTIELVWRIVTSQSGWVELEESVTCQLPGTHVRKLTPAFRF